MAPSPTHNIQNKTEEKLVATHPRGPALGESPEPPGGAGVDMALNRREALWGEARPPFWWQEWERGSDQWDTLRGKEVRLSVPQGGRACHNHSRTPQNDGDFDLKRE